MESTITKNNTIMIRKSEISLLKANLLGILFLAVVVGVLIPLFNWIWGVGSLNIIYSDLISVFEPMDYILEYLSMHVGIMLAGMIGGVITILYAILLFSLVFAVPHELIHGITWMITAKAKWKDIKFGVLWKKLCTPYCHCEVPMNVNQYRIALLMPLIVLGIVPSILSLIIGNGLLLCYGIMGIVGAIGDISMAWLLRKESATAKIYDHPSAAAFFLFDTDEEFEEIKKSI